jgi:hypothetical protein
MKRQLFWAFALSTLLFSCRKGEHLEADPLTTGMKESITQYVNANKAPKSEQLNKDLDELVAAMDFSQLHKESYKPNEDIWVVPVSNNYVLTGGIASNNATLSFIVFADRNGRIRTGKLARYIPQQGSTMPANTFHDFYTFNSNLNGTYEFYASWRKISETYKYNNGMLRSHGLAKPKPKTPIAGRTTEEYDCEVYVWEEKHYDQYGNLLYTTEDWLFVVCTLDEHPWIQTLEAPPYVPLGAIFDEDYDLRHVLATIHWSYGGPGSSGWTLNFETAFRGIKDLATPANNYFYYTAQGAPATVTSSNPDYYWDGYYSPSISSTTTVDVSVVGSVKQDFPFNDWPVGTVSTPYIKVFTFSQVFP